MEYKTEATYCQAAELAASKSNIPEAFAVWATLTPDKPATILELEGEAPHVISFADLAKQSQAFAATFRQFGLKPGAIVVIMLVSHAALPAALLGAMMAGLVPSLFPPATQKMDREVFWAAQAAVFERIEASLIIARSADLAEIADLIPDLGVTVLDVDSVELREVVDQPDVSAAGSDIACLQHSSGTTGAKKGVILTHEMLMRSVTSLGSALDIGGEDIVVSWLPLYHDMGLINCLFVPLLLGLTVVQLDPFEWVARPPLLLEAIGRHRATLCWMPNFAFHHLVRTTPRRAQYDLSSIRVLINAAEPCKAETLAMFREHFAPHSLDPLAMQVGYGMAENVCIASQTDLRAPPRTVTAGMDSYMVDKLIRPARPGEASIRFVSCGTAIPDTRLRIVDSAGETLPDGCVGQIAVTSTYLFSGYYRREMRPGTLVNGWYMSGDLGFMMDGELYVSGRADDLLIINGRNLYAHDVEFAINSGTGVKPGRCVALGPYSVRLGSQALVVIAEIADEDEAIRKALGTQIREVAYASFGVTTFDVRIKSPGWLVKTTSGKISREANLRLYLQERPVS